MVVSGENGGFVSGGERRKPKIAATILPRDDTHFSMSLLNFSVFIFQELNLHLASKIIIATYTLSRPALVSVTHVPKNRAA